MSELTPQELSPEEQEKLIEDEARSKIRQFVDDPHLKFHFSRTQNLPKILEKGILSQAFAERIGQEHGDDFRHVDAAKQYRSVSIADRDKNDPAGEPENIDWWIKRFADFSEQYNYGGAGYTGLLLPNDLRVRDYDIHPHESHVPIRISPKQIEGLFVIDKDELFGRVSYHPQGSGDEAYQKRVEDSFTDKDLVIHFNIGGFDSADELRGAARILGTPDGFVRPIDILIFFAKKAHVPLYLVNKDFTEQQVVWPSEKKRELTFDLARNFSELYSLIDHMGGVQGKQEFYEPAVLKDLIGKVKDGKLGLEHITRSKGLRERVSELIEQKKLW